MVALIRQRGVSNPAVLDAMLRVPRQRFTPPALHDRAYDDCPLPIGYGQTISQPYIVALMSEALELEPGDKVLEIGTGSGYQAAILAEMGLEVYSVEIVPALYTAARATFAALNYANIHTRLGDGGTGWPEHAPYQGIIVTAAPRQTPAALITQLADGGRLVIPVGPPGGYQTLWQITRHGEELCEVDLGGVAFVPFVGNDI